MNFFKLLKKTVFPPSFTCDACGIEIFEGHLCPDCLKRLPLNDKLCCPICGRKTVRPEICIECKSLPPLFECAVSPLLYDEVTISLIHKFKNGGAYLKDFFAELIVEKLKDVPSFDYITFVPMTKKSLKKRGYNQAKLLAESISERVGVPVVDSVEKIKDTREQKSLSRKQREENLGACFKPISGVDFHDKNVLLVDDILTTGATADAVCRKIFSRKVDKVFLATIASVEYKHKN